MDESEQRVLKARDYQKARQKLTLIHLAITPLALWAVMALPFSQGMKDIAFSLTRSPYLALSVYFFLLSIYFLIFDLPFSFYSGFVLEHRYGLSTQRLRDWVVYFIKKSLLSYLISWLLLGLLYAFIWNFPMHWWFLAWAGYAGVNYLLGKIFPVWIVPLFYRYGKVRDEELKRRILELVRRYGLPAENVFSLNLSKTTRKANAAFMGLGKTKRVVLSDTLIQNFSADEIEVVVAHELGHYKHRDILKQLVFGILASFVTFRVAFALVNPLTWLMGVPGVEDLTAIPALFLIFYFCALVLTPLQSGLARWLERAADRFALEATRARGSFISCMKKLAEVNLSDPDPDPVYEWFFFDHPSLGKRIRMAEAWSARPAAEK